MAITPEGGWVLPRTRQEERRQIAAARHVGRKCPVEPPVFEKRGRQPDVLLLAFKAGMRNRNHGNPWSYGDPPANLSGAEREAYLMAKRNGWDVQDHCISHRVEGFTNGRDSVRFT